MGSNGVSTGRAVVAPDGIAYNGGTDGDNVFAGRQLVPYLCVQRRGEAGRPLPRGMAVDINRDQTVRRGVNGRAANDRTDRKLNRQANGGGLSRGGTGADPRRVFQGGLLHVITRQIGGDPAAFPFVGRIQQSQFEGSDVAPRGGLTVLVPHADLPENLRTRTERLPGPRNQNGLIRNNFTGIPKVGRGGLQTGRR